MTGKKKFFISCGVLRREVEAIVREQYRDAETIFLDSILHMKPRLLRDKLESAMKGCGGASIVLVYGDCHPYMHETEAWKTCARTSGINCCDILLGHEQYRTLQREGAFIFLPEWTERWREIFSVELGLSDQKAAKDFMHEMRSRMVYLDTGIMPVPVETIREIEAFFEMKVDILPVPADTLRSAIAAAVQKLDKEGDG